MCGSHREAWRWCDGALLVTRSVIYLELKAHLTNMTTTAFCSDTPSHLVCDGVLHQMTWPPQSPDLNPIEIVWEELDCRVKEKQPTSAQHIKSNQILFVTYTWLADVNASVAKCLCF